MSVRVGSTSLVAHRLRQYFDSERRVGGRRLTLELLLQPIRRRQALRVSIVVIPTHELHDGLLVELGKRHPNAMLLEDWRSIANPPHNARDGDFLLLPQGEQMGRPVKARGGLYHETIFDDLPVGDITPCRTARHSVDLHWKTKGRQLREPCRTEHTIHTDERQPEKRLLLKHGITPQSTYRHLWYSGSLPDVPNRVTDEPLRKFIKNALKDQPSVQNIINRTRKFSIKKPCCQDSAQSLIKNDAQYSWVRFDHIGKTYE